MKQKIGLNLVLVLTGNIPLKATIANLVPTIVTQLLSLCAISCCEPFSIWYTSLESIERMRSTRKHAHKNHNQNVQNRKQKYRQTGFFLGEIFNARPTNLPREQGTLQLQRRVELTVNRNRLPYLTAISIMRFRALPKIYRSNCGNANGKIPLRVACTAVSRPTI